MLLIVGFLLVLQPPTARAQKQVSDKDMDRMMKNLRYDTKNFRPVFDHALAKSTIRKTSQAKDAKNLVATFQNQVDDMLTTFKKNRNDGSAVSSAVNTAGQVDSLLRTVNLGPDVMSQWQKIQEELHPIAVSYGIQESYRDDRTSGMAGDDSVSCLQSAGAVKANRLVNRMPAGLAGNASAVQCAECLLADHQRNSPRLFHAESGCARILCRLPIATVAAFLLNFGRTSNYQY